LFVCACVCVCVCICVCVCVCIVSVYCVCVSHPHFVTVHAGQVSIRFSPRIPVPRAVKPTPKSAKPDNAPTIARASACRDNSSLEQRPQPPGAPAGDPPILAPILQKPSTQFQV